MTAGDTVDRQLPDWDVVATPETVLGDIPTDETLRGELAAAARSRGCTTPIAGELADLRTALAELAVEPIDLSAARRRVADATGAEERLTERIAALRGNVQARREIGVDPTPALEKLETAATELSRVQTTRIAAEQAFTHARRSVARARDTRERRLALRDRLRNREREARKSLAECVYPSFAAALPTVPGGTDASAGRSPAEYTGPRLTASFAAVAVAELERPVALSERATAWANSRPGSLPAAVRPADDALQTIGQHDRRA